MRLKTHEELITTEGVSFDSTDCAYRMKGSCILLPPGMRDTMKGRTDLYVGKDNIRCLWNVVSWMIIECGEDHIKITIDRHTCEYINPGIGHDLWCKHEGCLSTVPMFGE